VLLIDHAYARIAFVVACAAFASLVTTLVVR